MEVAVLLGGVGLNTPKQSGLEDDGFGMLWIWFDPPASELI